jgi:hypothetical protein
MLFGENTRLPFLFDTLTTWTSTEPAVLIAGAALDRVEDGAIHTEVDDGAIHMEVDCISIIIDDELDISDPELPEP